jgi:hypothetical protein
MKIQLRINHLEEILKLRCFIRLTGEVYYYYYYLVYEAIGTATTPGLLCQPRMIVQMQMECRLAGETEVLGENLPQLHFCRSQNPT